MKLKKFSASYIHLFILSLVFLFSSQCASFGKKDKTEFSYQKIEKETYTEGMGGVIPLTMESGEGYGGWITPDERYLVFTSNRSGNFDIYVRALNDIDIFPVTSLPSNQIEPVLSPDGKKIAYIDDELDPDGDLIVQSISPAAAYKSQKAGRKLSFRSLIESFFTRRKNLTNSVKDRLRSTESNPAWSPDSKHIAFSSDMTSFPGSPFGPGIGAIQNIWILEYKKPQNTRRLTEKGGVMPSFSPDGKKIVYVSYQTPNQNGDIFEIDVATGKTQALTNTPHLDLSPAYMPDGKSIIFTRISEDSNGDGSIDRKDNGVIFLLNLETSQLTRLSFSALNLFDTHISKFHKGSILLSFAQDETINVGYIPLSGIIPKKETIDSQLSFAESYSDTWYNKTFPQYAQGKINEPYLMAIDRISLFYPHSSQYVVLSTLKDFYKLGYFDENRYTQEAQDLRQNILQKINNGENLYRIYLDLESLKSGKKSWSKLPPLEKAGNSAANYLRKIVSKPALYLAHYGVQEERGTKLNRKSTESLKENSYSMTLPYLMDLYGQELENEGKPSAANINYRRLFKSYPDYFRIGEILWEQGRKEKFINAQQMLAANTTPALPKEFLWLLYPKRYSEQNFLSYIDFPPLQDMVKEHLLQQFIELSARRQWQVLDSLLKTYPQNLYPEIHYLIFLGSASQYVTEGNSQKALAELAKATSLVPPNSYWQFLFHLLSAKSHELKNNDQEAMSQYAQALLVYLPAYDYSEIDSLIQRVNSHYLASAQGYLSRSEYFKSWEEYKKLLLVYQNLHNNNVKNENISTSAVTAYMNVDELAFMNLEKDPKLMREIEKFYDTHLGTARRNLNHPFIFGRGYLYTQLGIYLHRKFETQLGGILRLQKKKVLQLFKSAQRDFEWSFMANPTFVDSYIMLGWMYQYIDEKREEIIQPESKRKDKEVFSRLYSNYFPRYLFEENIRIYQKSIANLKNKTSQRILINFHLNMANNYFLLNNFGKAKENYNYVADNIDKGYRFENETQKALFYFNRGRSLFFTGNYYESYDNLQHSYQLYQNLAPIETSSPEDNQRNQKKRELILQYMVLSSQYNLNYKEALEGYNTILKEQKIAQSKTDNATLYLEMARLNKELGDIAKDQNYYRTTLEILTRAQEALDVEKEILPPKMPIRVRFLGLTFPVTGNKNYDRFLVGENRFPFLLPTLQKKQYLASIQADAYSGLGLLSQAESSLIKLEDYCKIDTSSHGKECLMSSYMRLGYNRYQMGNITHARSTYEEAIKFARGQKNLAAELQARKNLLAISAYEIENREQSPQDKIQQIEKAKKDLSDFQNQYIDESLNAAQAELKKTNKKLTLTEQEKIYLQDQKMKDIYPLLLYEGVFNSYLNKIQEQQAQETLQKNSTYTQYIEAKQKNVSTFFSAIETLHGNITFRGKKYNYLDPQRDRKKILTLMLNRARTYQDVSFNAKAIDEYVEASRRAEEFQASVAYAAAWYGLLQTDYNFEDNRTVSDSLEKSFSLLTSNQILSQHYPEIYKEVISGYSLKAKQMQDYSAALILENSKRHFSAWNSIRHQFPELDGAVGNLISRYRQLEVIEAALQNKIEDLRFQRQDSEDLEKYAQEIVAQRNEIFKKLTSIPEAQNISQLLFSQTLRKDDLEKILFPFVFIVQNKENYSFWYAQGSRIEYREFIISSKEVQEYASTLLKISHEAKSAKQTITPNKTSAPVAPIATALANEKETETKLNEKELAPPEWVLWLKEKNPELIFPDGDFWDFPFEKTLGHPYLTSSTLQATLMFQKNNSISFERWLQAGHNSNLFAYSSVPKENKKTIASAQDFHQFALWSDALDYQSKLTFTNHLRNQTQPQLSQILNTNYSPTVAVLTNERDSTASLAHLRDYAAGSELLMAAQGVSLVIFSAQNRATTEPVLQLLFKKNQPQFSSQIKISGNPMLFYAWLDDSIPFGERKDMLASLTQSQFNSYYMLGKERAEKEQYASALQATERANFALVRKDVLENSFYAPTFEPFPPVHYLNAEQFNFRNDILFSLQDKKTADEEYNYKFKQLAPPPEENKPLSKDKIAENILTPKSGTIAMGKKIPPDESTLANKKIPPDESTLANKKNYADKKSIPDDWEAPDNFSDEAKDLLFSYSNRLIRFQYVKEGIEKIRPLRKKLNNAQLYLLSESFFLAQSLSGRDENLQDYDPLLQQYIQTIGFPAQQDAEAKIDFFIGKTKRQKEWLQVLYQGLYWKRYTDVLNMLPVKNSDQEKLLWLYTYLPRYVDFKNQSLDADAQKWLASLDQSQDTSSFEKYAEKRSDIFTKDFLAQKENQKFFSEAMWYLQSTPQEKDNYDNLINKSAAAFTKLLEKNQDIILHDAVLLTLWQKIQKRDIPPSALQKLTNLLAKLSAAAQKKFDMGVQRKVFYTMLGQVSAVMQDPMRLQTSLTPYANSSFSSFNRSLYNQILIFSAGYRPQVMANMAYQTSKLYFYDESNIQILNQLQLFNLFYKNADLQNARDFLGAVLADTSPIGRQSVPIYLTYLLEEKNYKEALSFYLTVQGQNISSWQAEYPLLGIFSTYPYAWYSWKWAANSLPQMQALILDSQANLIFNKPKEAAFVFLPVDNLYLRKTWLGFARQSIYLTRLKDFNTALLDEKNSQLKISWSAQKEIEPEFSPLFYANLGKEAMKADTSFFNITSKPIADKKNQHEITVIAENLNEDPVSQNNSTPLWKIYYSGLPKDKNIYLNFLDIFISELKQQTKLSVVDAFLRAQEKLYNLYPQLKDKNNVWMYR